MKYEIKKYREEYIDEQVRIGSSIYNKWPMGGQTKKDQLLKAYNADDFDPDTRLYAFNEGGMVGFITGALITDDTALLKAHFEPPYVLEKHREVENLLIDNLLEVMRRKSVKELITRAGSYWGRSSDLVVNYDFTYDKDIVRRGEIYFDKIQVLLKEPVEAENYSFEKHNEKLEKLIIEEFKMTPERAKNMVELSKDIEIGKALLNPWDIAYHYVSNLVIVRGEKIVGRAVVIHNDNFGKKSSILMSLWSKDEDEHLEGQLLSQIRDDCESMGYYYLIIHTGPWGQPNTVEKKWENRGIIFTRELAYYTKSI
ncbi:MAG: hypothetical protein GPJ54_09685 [Candidatus Heimdallarchaeota archaeon]|nr:hypothetical protein [Candidatus Heimdallarchaeota archaeon]